MTDQALQRLSPRFERMYADIGRPSIALEKLLRALLLQVLYTIRSERMLMEQLDYNLLFRWFVGLNMDDVVWVPTVFSKNRDRLLEGAVAEAFFDEVLREAGEQELLSEEHFTVDGTLLEAWASQKSFQRKATPHVAQNQERRRSAIDSRTTRHPGYQISQRARKKVEERFGWMKTVGLLRKLRHRGLERVGWIFTFTAAAFNLVRIRNLVIGAGPPLVVGPGAA